jgi:hypothetical protein
LIKNGASITIKNNRDKDVYHKCFRAKGQTPTKYKEYENFYTCNAKVFSYIHATMVAQRHLERQQSFEFENWDYNQRGFLKSSIK